MRDWDGEWVPTCALFALKNIPWPPIPQVMIGTGPKQILVVDDEPLIREMLSMLLSIDGHQVDTAANGEEALAKFAAASFDVVLIDRKMPGLPGNEVVRQIKHLNPAQAIIMLSGSPPIPVPAEVGAVILKPFASSDLRKALAAVAA